MKFNEIDNIIGQLEKFKTKLEELDKPEPINEKEELLQKQVNVLSDYVKRYCSTPKATRGIPLKDAQYRLGITSAYRFDQILFRARMQYPELEIVRSSKGRVIIDWKNNNTKTDEDLTPEELSLLQAKVVISE